MLFGRNRKRLHSLVVRLSLTYAACCCVSMIAVLVVCYLFLEGTLRQRMDSALAAEVMEYGALLQTQNLLVLDDVLRREALSEGTDQVFFRILDGAGQVLVTTDTSSWKGLMAGGAYLQTAIKGRLVFVNYYDPERDFHARVLYGKIGDDRILQLGESLAGNLALLSQFREVFTIATLAFVLLSLLAGAYMARRALAGVQRVTQAAVEITAGAWAHRVPISSHQDEIDDLASAFNTMVERIQVLFRELREVTDDIAHDLRTPLMRIHGEAEMALRESGGDGTGQERFGSVLEECAQMLNLINTMLEISQTEAGARPLEFEQVDLDAIAEDLCELFRPAAEDKELDLSFSGGQAVLISGDRQRLKRALAHLLDNAIKYTPAGGRVEVCCRLQGSDAEVIVSDTGIGIPSDVQTDVFSRFYRVDSSRSEPGNGLGLSLSQAIIRAHGGQIILFSAAGNGSTFTVRIPRAQQ